MTPAVTIVADDLTGAGDTAVQFTAAGWAAELRLRPGPSNADVLSVSTDSRAQSPADAAAAVADVVREIRQAGPCLLYKKIDSTVRGPVRAEVDAALRELGPDVVAVVCPAFPAVGRTVVDGTLLVLGVPVAEGPAGNDPVTPVHESHLPSLLGAPLVRLEPASAPSQWMHQLTGHGRVVVVDAADEDGLDRIAQAVVGLENRVLPVGSGGLAAPLARLWRAEAAPEPVVVIVTSLHDAARSQCGRLAVSGAQRHQPTIAQLRDETCWQRFTDDVRRAVRDEKPTVVLISAPEPEGEAVTPTLVAARLAEIVAHLVGEIKIAGLVLTGGDGARAVLTALDASAIRLAGAVEPGVPLGTLVDGVADAMPIATKAGGFGGDEILVKTTRAVRTLRSIR